MTILGLETSAKAAGCAVSRDDNLLAESFLNNGLTHSQTIMPMVDAMLKSARLTISEIDLFAVAGGPGSFTGLRIGLSAVKALAMASEKPCVGVSTLESLAYNLEAFSGYIVPAMDARRSQVYTAVFCCKGGEISRLCDDAALPVEVLGERIAVLSGPKMLVGDGAELCYGLLRDKVPELLLAPRHIRFQRAASVCAAARRKAAANAAALCGAEALAPVYLRLSQAERERSEKLKYGENAT